MSTRFFMGITNDRYIQSKTIYNSARICIYLGMCFVVVVSLRRDNVFLLAHDSKLVPKRSNGTELLFY